MNFLLCLGLGFSFARCLPDYRMLADRKVARLGNTVTSASRNKCRVICLFMFVCVSCLSPGLQNFFCSVPVIIVNPSGCEMTCLQRFELELR